MVGPIQITQQAVPNATLLLPWVPEDGGSQPRVCDFDDMVIRLVKWHPSSHGLTASYSELVASRIAQLTEAPVIRGNIVYVDPVLLPSALRDRVRQPFHVGFTYSPGHNFREADYTGIQNSAALPAAAVHLAWLQVEDQRGHNQYLYQLEQVLPDKTTRRMNHFVSIDQAFLCGTPDWSTASLDRPEASYELPAHLKSRVSMSSVERLIELVRSIDEGTIRSCFDFYPESWSIPPDSVERLTDFVLRRRQHLGAVLRSNLI